MKYKIIPEDVIKNLVEFLDDVQSEAAETKNSPEELQKINFCSWAISQLINSTRAYGPFEDEERPATKDEKWDIIDEYFLDFNLPEDMTKKEIDKMMNQFEGFFKGWDKSYKKSKHTTGKKKKTLRQFRNNLIKDDELTPQEKFELYYEEYKKEKYKPKNLNSILKKLGLRKSSGGSDTH